MAEECFGGEIKSQDMYFNWVKVFEKIRNAYLLFYKRFSKFWWRRIRNSVRRKGKWRLGKPIKRKWSLRNELRDRKKDIKDLYEI